MEKCPSEIWTHIFLLACVDGGLTGCALSLVSHYFREVVLPVQLHSVALKGAGKMSVFSDLLARRAPEHRRVRHLFLTGLAKDVATHTAHERSEFSYRILSTVAPELLTFTSTLSQGRVSEHSILRIPFPVLEELTIHGFFLYPDAVSTTEWQDSFPSLRYLHLLSSCNSASFYTSRSPNLTYLRLSDAENMSTPLSTSLLHFLANNVPSREHLAPFPPTLRKVFLQDGRTVRYLGQAGKIRLDTFVKADKERRLVLLEHDYARMREIMKRGLPLRRDWEDRIVGGPGCWKEPRRRSPVGFQEI